MKPLLAIVCVLLAAVAGAVGGMIAAPVQVAVQDSSATIALAPPSRAETTNASANTSLASDAALGQRVDALTRQVADLEAELARIQDGTGRKSAIEPVAAKPLDDSAAVFAAQHKEAILQVIAADRELQAKLNEKERLKRDAEALLARTDRIAKKFGLSADQQRALTDVFTRESLKMDELRETMRAQGGPQSDPQLARDAFRDMRDWRMNEMTKQFGDDLAQKINEAEGGRWGGGGPGFAGRRNGNGGNNGANGGQPNN